MKIFLMEQIVACQNYYQWQAFPLADPVRYECPLFELKVYVLQTLPEMEKWFCKLQIHAYLHPMQEGPWDYALIYSLLQEEMVDFGMLAFTPEDLFVVS